MEITAVLMVSVQASTDKRALRKAHRLAAEWQDGYRMQSFPATEAVLYLNAPNDVAIADVEEGEAP